MWNESGNSPDPYTLNNAVIPPHFMGHDRVLEPGNEWPIAMLGQLRHFRAHPRLNWKVRARGLPERARATELKMVEPPPV